MKTHLWSTSFCNSLQMSSSFCCNLFLRCSGGRWEKSSVTVGCKHEQEGWLSLKLNHRNFSTKKGQRRHLRRVRFNNWQKLSFNLPVMHLLQMNAEPIEQSSESPKNTPVKQSLLFFNAGSIIGIIWGAWELFFVQLFFFLIAFYNQVI